MNPLLPFRRDAHLVRPRSRRAMVIGVLSLATALGGRPGAAHRPSPTAAAQARPNIVLVMADDLDQLLGTMEHTPHINRLVRDAGISLERYLITDSLCCPSRTTYLRGQYPHNHGVLTNTAPDGGYEKLDSLGLEASTVATWLQAAGYRTGFAGKYVNGFPLRDDLLHIPPGWDHWASPMRGNAYASYNYTLNVDGRQEAHGEAAADHITDVLAGHARAFLSDMTGSAAPFFLMVTPYAPHSPSDPAPRHAALFPDAQVPRSPSFNEADMSDKPPPLRLRAALTDAQIAEADALYRKRLQAMQAVDEMVAALVADLEASGELADTLFIFTSDNGYHLGQHRLPEGKAMAYEEDIRVPFFARGPGIAAGGKDDTHLVANIDLAPTLAQIAGAQVPDFVDGRSFGWLLGHGAPPATWRQALLVEQYPLGSPAGGDPDPLGSSTARRPDPRGSITARQPEPLVAPSDAGLLEPIEGTDRLLMEEESARPSRTETGPGIGTGLGLDLGLGSRPNQSSAPAPLYIALRDARHTYIEHRSGATELYDNTADPYQLESQSRRAPAEQLAALSAWVRALQACAGEGCRRVEDAGPEGAATATVAPTASADPTSAAATATAPNATATASGFPTAVATPSVTRTTTPNADDGHRLVLPLVSVSLRGGQQGSAEGWQSAAFPSPSIWTPAGLLIQSR